MGEEIMRTTKSIFSVYSVSSVRYKYNSHRVNRDNREEIANDNLRLTCIFICAGTAERLFSRFGVSADTDNNKILKR